MSWNSITNYHQPEPRDIVEDLRDAAAEQRQQLKDAMITIDERYEPPGTLYTRAANEIEKLRRILGITEN